jgi:hypothetical protein
MLADTGSGWWTCFWPRGEYEAMIGASAQPFTVQEIELLPALL